MKRTLTSIIIIVLAVAIVFSAAKNTVARLSVEKGVEVVTGLRLKMRSLSIGVITTNVDIEDMRLFNPPAFEDRVMLDMPEIYVDYDLPAILKGKVHLPEARINLKEFVVVKDKNGKLNLDSLKVVQQEKEGAAQAAEPKEKGKAPAIQIDSLQLKIGKVIYKDYSKGGMPSIQEFDINIDEKYTDINDPNQLVSLIVVKALMNTTIGRLANFDVKGLEGNLGDTLKNAQQVSTEAAAKAQETVKATAETAKETAKTATETVKSTAENLKSVFKGAK